jgi:hypothetical protein
MARTEMMAAVDALNDVSETANSSRIGYVRGSTGGSSIETACLHSLNVVLLALAGRASWRAPFLLVRKSGWLSRSLTDAEQQRARQSDHVLRPSSR